jgi:thiosulfate dehydrogenase [quinone] large subunit
MLESFERTTTREQQFAYAVLRSFLGICFCAHGFLLLFFGSGLPSVASHMMFALAETQLPPSLTLLFGYSLPFIDILIGSMLILGVATLPAITLAILYLFILVISFALEADYLSLVIVLGTGCALAFLLVGHKRFDLPWHRLLIKRKTQP